MVTPCWEPLKCNNGSRIWVEWDTVFNTFWYLTPKHTAPPSCGGAQTAHCVCPHLLHRPLSQNHTCFPFLRPCSRLCLCHSVKCGSLMVVPYLVSFRIPSGPMALLYPVLCLSSSSIPSQPCWTTSLLQTTSHISAWTCMEHPSWPLFPLPISHPRGARRLLPSYGDNGKSCYQTLKIFSAAFRRLNVGRIHMTNICVTVRENWVLRGETKGK